MPLYDIAWTFGGIFILIVMAVELLSLRGALQELGTFWSVVWCLAIVLLPLIGPAAWFIHRGPRSSKTSRAVRR